MAVTSGKKAVQKTSLIERAVVASAQLTRYAIKGKTVNKDKPVMTTNGLEAFVEKGVTNWTFELSNTKVISPQKIKLPFVSVSADWLSTQQALEKGVDVVYGNSANSFGSLGALLLPGDFKIPTVLASIDNVKHYGLSLIENNSEFAISSEQYQIAMMRYDYNKDYKKDFLMQKYGGGGVFVETHNFPHVHIPLSKKCGGYIVIGKQIAANEYHFTAFQIPYGYALYTPSNTIHGDGTLVGEYALTVADGAFCHAETVLMYNRDTLSMSKGVVADWKI
ncbi:MAG: hypothetical protein OEY29_03990 [Gammaproteobacteria bacterium]|nr:hypothetical protein [Gammaproteobacteria bacterium]